VTHRLLCRDKRQLPGDLMGCLSVGLWPDTRKSVPNPRSPPWPQLSVMFVRTFLKRNVATQFFTKFIQL
jgi:hypothetical protein